MSSKPFKLNIKFQKKTRPSNARYSNRNARRNEPDTSKRCTACRHKLPPEAFGITRYGTLSSWCRICTREAKRLSAWKRTGVVRGKENIDKVKYPHPDLKNILKDEKNYDFFYYINYIIFNLCFAFFNITRNTR